MSTDTQYTCDRCGFSDLNQWKFSPFTIAAKGERSGHIGHLCDECRGIVVKVLSGREGDDLKALVREIRKELNAYGYSIANVYDIFNRPEVKAITEGGEK
jgi:hypothetical protein